MEDLKQYGQREPVHVLPPKNKAGYEAYTLLDGHRRAQLLAKLGQKKIDAIVRHDLLDADAVTVDAMFLRPNALRRQLSKLELARVAYELFQIDESRKREFNEDSVRERIGKLIGMSGRNLSRYWCVLNCPLEVQRAVDEGRAKLVSGAKAGLLNSETQTELALALRAAAPEEAQKIIENFVGTPSAKHVDATSAFHALVRSLEKHRGDLTGRLSDVNPVAIGHCRADLKKARRLIDALLKRAKTPPSEAEQDAEIRAAVADLIRFRNGTPCPPPANEM